MFFKASIIAICRVIDNKDLLCKTLSISKVTDSKYLTSFAVGQRCIYSRRFCLVKYLEINFF